MKKRNFWIVRFNFFFAALLILVLYWAFFSMYTSFSSFRDKPNRGYYPVWRVGGTLNDYQKGEDSRMVNARGDSLIIAPVRLNAFVKMKGANEFRDAKYAPTLSGLKILRIAILIAVFILALILLIRFFAGVRRNTTFDLFNIRSMRWLALLVLIFWFVDAWWHYIDFKSIRYLFEGTAVQLYYNYPTDKFLLLMIAAILFFLSEVMVVGNRLNEENKMTI